MNDSSFASLEGLRTLVTGSSTGIGRAIAREFAAAGAAVLVHASRPSTALEQVARDLHEEFGHRTGTLSADFQRVGEIKSLADQAWQYWGGIDVWVNNAGVDLLTGPRAKLDYAEKLQLLLDIDVRGTILLSRDVGERMQAARSGVILNIGWDQADRGMEGASGELFAAAKNAIMGFTRSLAVSLAPEVRVNCIAPGWIRTAWGDQAHETWQARVLRETPLQRWGVPEDIASLARYLASPAAAYLTGQVFNANGGAVR